MSTLAPVFFITGQVTAGGSVRPGVTITLSGSASASTTTDSNGNYSFVVPPANGTYTVTPSLAGYAFSPASQTFGNVNANQTANFNASGAENSAPDPPPASYPDSVAVVPIAPAGSCNITGTWADGASGATWSIVQTGNSIAGNATGTPPAQYGCGQTITWQVSGTIAGSVANLNASGPSPAVQSCSSGVQWTASNPLTAAVTFSGCSAGSANETATYPAGSQFAPGGGGPTTISGSGPWTMTSSPATFTISSPSQIGVPDLPSAQIAPMSVIDSPQLNTTASLSNYSFTVGYPTTFLGNTDSNCQTSLSIPNGSNSASSSISASAAACSDGNSDGSGIFTAYGSIGQSNTQNALYVVVPPLILARELYGEAHGQIAVGDNVSELAIGNAIRNRFGDHTYFPAFNYWQSMATYGGFDGLSICKTGCLNGADHSAEVTNAALLFVGVNTPATDVDGSRCFFSPTSPDWQKVSQALQSQTTVFPGPLTQDSGCWVVPNRQIVYKTSVGQNADGRGAPAFLFEQWRLSSDPAVTQIP